MYKNIIKDKNSVINEYGIKIHEEVKRIFCRVVIYYNIIIILY